MNNEISRINEVIATYFESNPSIEIIPVKELMPAFIEAGIFKKDIKNGKPIRDILNTLNKSNSLGEIPYLHTIVNNEDTYWYFVPKDAPKTITSYKQTGISKEKIELENKRLLSDKYYVINLCDMVLKQSAKRQKRFDFLVGDLHKDGKTKTELPVDAFYAELNLVIEYKEAPEAEQTGYFNNQTERTVSGINRAAQRIKYDKRKAAELPLNGIKLIELQYSIFNCDEQKKIIRDLENDLKMIENVLSLNQISY